MDPGEKIPNNSQGMDEFMAEIYPLHPAPDIKQDRANWFKVFLEETEKSDREIIEHIAPPPDPFADTTERLAQSRKRNEQSQTDRERDLVSSRLALWNARLDELRRSAVKGGILDSEEYRGAVALFESMVASLRPSPPPLHQDNRPVRLWVWRQSNGLDPNGNTMPEKITLDGNGFISSRNSEAKAVRDEWTAYLKNLSRDNQAKCIEAETEGLDWSGQQRAELVGEDRSNYSRRVKRLKDEGATTP